MFDRSEELDAGGFHTLTNAGDIVNDETDYRGTTEEPVVDIPLSVDVNLCPVTESKRTDVPSTWNGSSPKRSR